MKRMRSTPPFALSFVFGFAERPLSVATSALYGRAGPVTVCNRAKSNQKRLPLHPASPCGARNGRDASTAHESSADATHSVCRRRIYDRPLLRSSARAEGAFEPIFDRFAIGSQELFVRRPCVTVMWLICKANTTRIAIHQLASKGQKPHIFCHDDCQNSALCPSVPPTQLWERQEGSSVGL